MPTVAEHLPAVVAAASPGTRRTYGSSSRRMVAALGDRRIDAVRASDLEALMRQTTADARPRRNSRSGRHAGEQLIAAARAFTIAPSFVLGFDALDTGLRLLPLIGGLVAGAGIATRLTTRTGHRTPILAGLAITTAGLLTGALTDTTSSYGFIATWYAIVGLGIGATLAPSMDAVLAVMPAERSGAGIAITMTMRQTGGALGVALLGSLLSTTYRDRIDPTGLPVPAVEAATQSIAGTMAVAHRLELPVLADAAGLAYVDAMVYVLFACALVAALGAVATMLFMPAKASDRPTANSLDQVTR
ncbi:MFS transporter [Micromonospora sp. NPDC085948]|uniref:MFS transporter n=1 Tax=Micromonospora sp. NPDC085948 TaxID=3155293 RepID=UPI003442C8FE